MLNTIIAHSESMQLNMWLVKQMFTPELILACHNEGVEYLLTQEISAFNFKWIFNIF